MIHVDRPRRWAPLLIAALLLPLVPASSSARDGAGAAGAGLPTLGSHAADDDLCWRACGVANGKGKGKGKNVPAQLAPTNKGQVRSIYAKRGGNRADSNPTTVPIVDTDFLFSVYLTHAQIGTAKAQRVTRGAGVVIAVLDGGFNLRHPDIEPHLHPWAYDAIDDDFDAHDTGNGFDDDLDGLTDRGVGHGTFVSGMILSVAPEATILPIRVRDDEGWGTNRELERGLVMAFALGADIINISGKSTHGRSEHLARWIAYLHAAGVVVVNSAGNDGADAVSEIADPNTTLVAGSVNQGDAIAPFSNHLREAGRYFVFAPGVDLYGPYGAEYDASHAYWSGTSFSTGLVSGGAALVRAIHPEWTAAQVMQQLTDSVAPAWSSGWRILPYGRLDLGMAVTK